MERIKILLVGVSLKNKYAKNDPIEGEGIEESEEGSRDVLVYPCLCEEEKGFCPRHDFHAGVVSSSRREWKI